MNNKMNIPDIIELPEETKTYSPYDSYIRQERLAWERCKKLSNEINEICNNGDFKGELKK